MKVLKIVLVVLAFSLMLFSVSIVEASEYLGDFCWSTVDDNENTIITKLGAFHLGGGHYQLLGTAEHSTEGTLVVRGNAEIVGNEIQASTFTIDGNNNAMTTIHSLATLDPSTFNGTFNQITTSAAGWTEQTEIRFYSGTMTSITCSN